MNIGAIVFIEIINKDRLIYIIILGVIMYCGFAFFNSVVGKEK